LASSCGKADGVASEHHAGHVLGPIGEHDRLTGLGHHRRHQRFVEGFEVIEQLVQRRRPLARRESGPDPVVEAAPCLGDGPAHVVGGRGRKLGDGRFVGRVLDGEGLPILDPPAPDERAARREDPRLSHLGGPPSLG